jgi:RimJ/RimL family protein N-acetyltransferase
VTTCPDVSLRPYGGDDFWLLERLLGDPGMTAFLGGPESPDALVARHERYLRHDESAGGLLTVLAGPEKIAVGWVGYWESSWAGETVWECGWHVLPEHQGRGIAGCAATLMLERAQEHGRYRFMHAFPSVDNVASNNLCRRLGFELLGEADIEYPKGHMMRSNNWRLYLGAAG